MEEDPKKILGYHDYKLLIRTQSHGHTDLAAWRVGIYIFWGNYL